MRPAPNGIPAPTPRREELKLDFGIRLELMLIAIDDEHDQIESFEIHIDGHLFTFDPNYDPKTSYKYGWVKYDPITRKKSAPICEPDVGKLRKALSREDAKDFAPYVLERVRYCMKFLKAPFLIRPIVALFEPIG